MLRATGRYLTELDYSGAWETDGETAEECWDALVLKKWRPEQIEKLDKETFIKRVNELANEYALTQIRTKRNSLLDESDWVMMSDVVLSNIDEWKDYRQALRDLPANITDYDNVEYPTKPT
tara:strand:- start:3468 stop:3830 length:363 start_codon:yes stop_codon:yes gene_type:complete